jgi:paraquat-inducible protein A
MPGPEKPTTGLQARVLSCHNCQLLTPMPDDEGAHVRCRRCGAALHARRPDSLNRTWALLIAAIIMYIPANLLPITLTTALGNTEGDTIMQGVIYFLLHGDLPVALVIFTASIMVPTLKISGMIYLLTSVQRHSAKARLNRAKIFRMVEFVGRWSMIDVFVVTIMVALVQLRAVATIQAGDGAIYFCSVVIITMLAAESFDPRLIWDKCGNDD